MVLYRDEGVVLRVQKLGEADRIITLLTKRHGRVRAVAKGVRRTRSKFGATVEPNFERVRRTPFATARTRPCRRVRRVMMRSASPSFCTRRTTPSSRYRTMAPR